MKTLQQFSETKLTKNDIKKKEIYKSRSDSSLDSLKRHGWKKTGEEEHTGGKIHIYKDEYSGPHHEIHLNPATGTWEHHVRHHSYDLDTHLGKHMTKY